MTSGKSLNCSTLNFVVLRKLYIVLFVYCQYLLNFVSSNNDIFHL